MPSMGLRSRGILFCQEGNIGAILGRILDVYWLSEEEPDKIRDHFIQSYKSLEALERYSRDLDDFQLGSMVKVVREYAPVLPDAVYDMMKISKNTTENRDGQGIILSTPHGAKGQGYDRVHIDPDIAASLSRPEAPLTNAFGDEANIAHVGFTRAIRELHLPRDFKTILTPGWRERIERYEPTQASRTPNAYPAPRKRAPRPSLSGKRYAEFTIETELFKPPRKKPFKIGNRVRTSHNRGTVIEVDGEKYLVSLDAQEGRLWEKDWGLKKV